MDRIIEKVRFDAPVQPKAKRVAAYARISSGKDAMLHSLSAQISYYSGMIQSHPGWLFAGVYSDEALTGTKENRSGFQSLLADCRKGKIDMVIVKSISRLTRNTVTLLETVRELKSLGVDVYFEEQNIHTLSSEGEMMLTILASYAQEESLSVSENQKWRIQKNFKEGKPWNNTMLGYRNVNGMLTVVPEEAEIVKRIFDMYLSGMGIQLIANTLNREGISTRLGAKFKRSAISKMLRNEAYAGNLLLQKTFKDNHITKRTMINRGELPMYYVENAHEAIIPPETFKKVQEMITQRAEKYAPPSLEKPAVYPFTSLITCAKCGKHFRRKTVRGKPVWICPTFNYEGKDACAAKQIPEEILEEITADMDMERIAGITAYDGNRLLFHFTDGTVTERVWHDRSRSDSWTDEMRQKAREQAKARNRKKMTERNVTVIPATKNFMHRTVNPAAVKRRVAGYARVSTDKDEQYTSYEAQVDYYTQFIRRHADWEFVKVYTDEGISGLGTRKRDGFNEMIDDAMSGAIDLIITKSVSRFARNTVDSLVTIRKLKDKGVEVYFEKENIYSLDGKGELLLTIMSSLAQEESRSISENVTWGQRKRFSDGKVNLPYKQFLGYERGETKDDPPVVNPEQAVLVRRIYRTFMEGKTVGAIAKELTAEGVPTPAGKDKWRASTINSILQNEKYRGSALLQKCFTTDFLTKKQKVNEGEVPQYYIEHSHEAIIDPLEWDAVQDEIRRRKEIGRAYSGTSVFSAKLVCGDCGGRYGHKTWHSTDKYRSTVWHCNHKYSGEKCKCSTPTVTEEEIKSRFISAFNSIISSKKPYIKACKTAKQVLTDTTSIDAEMADLLQEIEVVSELTRKCIEKNSAVAQDQKEFNDRYNGYVEKYEALKERYDALAAERESKLEKAKAIDRFIRTVESRDGLLTEFDPHLWLTTVEKVTITSDEKMLFHFFDGTEISG